jgi:serine/threonine protein kinase
MLESGQILQGRYQLQEKLGQNAGRQTWLAIDIDKTPQSAIVKLLAFSPQMQWEELKLFEREAEVLKNLNHPRIPRYRDSFSLDKQAGAGLYWFGLVQDYIPGSSLRQMLHRGTCFSEAQVRSFATGILEILIYLHELSPPVLHRDIKPSNLILGEDEQIYLVDFGAVQNRAVVEGATFTVVGTTGYTPLEQFWGRAVPASDLYALGATIIHLLTGTSPADLPQRNLRIQFSDRVSISPSFGRWIDAIAHPDIDQRFSTAREALAALTTGRSLTIPTPAISQPPDSRVQISKSPSQLKIKIPGSQKSFINNIGLAIALIKKLKNIKSNFNLPLLAPFGDYCIYLDKEKFEIERQLVGWSYLRYVGITSNIKDVKQIPLKAVTLNTGMVEYTFGQALSESEREWLAQELRGWLY